MIFLWLWKLIGSIQSYGFFFNQYLFILIFYVWWRERKKEGERPSSTINDYNHKFFKRTLLEFISVICAEVNWNISTTLNFPIYLVAWYTSFINIKHFNPLNTSVHLIYIFYIIKTKVILYFILFWLEIEKQQKIKNKNLWRFCAFLVSTKKQKMHPDSDAEQQTYKLTKKK